MHENSVSACIRPISAICGAKSSILTIPSAHAKFYSSHLTHAADIPSGTIGQGSHGVSSKHCTLPRSYHIMSGWIIRIVFVGVLPRGGQEFCFWAVMGVASEAVYTCRDIDANVSRRDA